MNAMETVTGEGSPRRANLIMGDPISQVKELVCYLLGKVDRDTEQCYLIGEWPDQVSNLGKAVRRLLGRDKMRSRRRHPAESQ